MGNVLQEIKWIVKQTQGFYLKYPLDFSTMPNISHTINVTTHSFNEAMSKFFRNPTYF